MKNLVKEVVFTAYGDWKIEAYAWCKELARRLDASFRVIQSEGKREYSEEFAHKLLRGDGYYFGHYNFAPIKTHLSSSQGELTAAFINYLNESSGLAVLVLDSKLKPVAQDTLNSSHHIVLSIPSPIERTSDGTEFTDILHQISVLNLPFNFVEEEKQSWLSKFFQNLRAFL